MAPQRQRVLFTATLLIIAVWLAAWAAYTLARKSKLTADKVIAHQSSLELEKLPAEARRKALQSLVDKLNALSTDERAKWHLDWDWFRQLTEEEKSWFIDAFLPGEMTRALAYFERLPRAQQQKDIDSALEELRRHAANPRRPAPGDSTNGPIFSPELDQKIRTMGLSALYGQASAQTKAELAPLLLEVQRQMENGMLDSNRF